VNSQGKNTLIAAAVAAVLGSQAAHALPPTATIDFTLYAGGGSAQVNAFYVGANTILSNLDSYTDQANGTDSGSYRVVSGTTKASFTFNGATVPAGKNVLYFYKFNGGSFANGIAPHQTTGATLLNYPTVTSVLSTAVTTGAAAGTGVPTYRYTSTLGNNQAPDWGIADVEVKMFQHFNNPTGNAGGAAQNTDGGPAPAVGATTGVYDNLFGVAVTRNVFTGAHPKTSFSRAEVEGILAGNVSDWSQLAADDGTQLAPGGIIFLDRGEGSGSKASGNQYFLNYPGSNNSVNPVSITPFSAGNAYNGTSLNTTATETTLDLAESSSSNLVNDLKLAQGRGLRAISILGIEFPPALNLNSSGAIAYDFVKINGVGVDTGTAGDDINGTTATSYINVVKGNYDYYFQNSFNTRTGVLTGTSTGGLFANEFLTVMSQPSFVGAFSGTAFPAAVPGTLVDADSPTVTALTAGVVINTRNKVSPAALQNALPIPAAGIPVSREPL
jgi:hypothetical protein